MPFEVIVVQKLKFLMKNLNFGFDKAVKPTAIVTTAKVFISVLIAKI